MKLDWVSMPTMLVLVLVVGRTPTVVLATSGTMEADALPGEGSGKKGGGESKDDCGDGNGGKGMGSDRRRRARKKNRFLSSGKSGGKDDGGDAAGGEEVPIEVVIGCVEGAAATEDVFDGFEEATMVDFGGGRVPGPNIGNPY